MRVLVCGGRDYANFRRVFSVLDYVHKASPISLIIHGDARGADKLAGEWARARHVPCTPYPARWDTDGKAAGPIRNQRMLDEGRPTMVLAFPGGAGTADMIARAEKRGGIIVTRLAPDE